MTPRRLTSIFGAWVILSIIVAGTFLLSLWPHHPQSALGWVVLVLTALPLAALGEFLGDRFIFHSDLGASLNSLGAGFLPSLVRVLYVLIMFLTLAAIAGLIITTLNTTGWVSAL
ncbi:MAG TPA: hypothetical protein VNS88_07185 [Nitrospiraceae bacterium]|nr:hypothetical protein [Nitrospiraceae bacterium]